MKSLGNRWWIKSDRMVKSPACFAIDPKMRWPLRNRTTGKFWKEKCTPRIIMWKIVWKWVQSIKAVVRNTLKIGAATGILSRWHLPCSEVNVYKFVSSFKFGSQKAEIFLEACTRKFSRAARADQFWYVRFPSQNNNEKLSVYRASCMYD